MYVTFKNNGFSSIVVSFLLSSSPAESKEMSPIPGGEIVYGLWLNL